MQPLSDRTRAHARTLYEDPPDPHRQRHLLPLWISLAESGSLRMRCFTARAGTRLLRPLAAGSARPEVGP